MNATHFRRLLALLLLAASLSAASALSLECGSSQVLGRTDYDAFGTLIDRTGSTDNSFLYCGERWDANLGFYYLRARFMNPGTGRFWTMDEFEGSRFDPKSLHLYTYCIDDPVNNIDPSGLATFAQQFGYDAEEVIQYEYKNDHLSDKVNFGGWSGLGPRGGFGFNLKPDILNYTQGWWAEVKPFTLTGIAEAQASYALYSGAFAVYGFTPDIWWEPTNHWGHAGARPFYFWNAGGVIFYTEMVDLAKQLALLTSFALAREYLRQISAKVLLRYLGPAMARIGVLAAGSKTVDFGRLEAHVGIGMLIATMGLL